MVLPRSALARRWKLPTSLNTRPDQSENLCYIKSNSRSLGDKTAVVDLTNTVRPDNKDTELSRDNISQ